MEELLHRAVRYEATCAPPVNRICREQMRNILFTSPSSVTRRLCAVRASFSSALRLAFLAREVLRLREASPRERGKGAVVSTTYKSLS